MGLGSLGKGAAYVGRRVTLQGLGSSNERTECYRWRLLLAGSICNGYSMYFPRMELSLFGARRHLLDFQ